MTLAPGSPVVLACSGGPDSTALAAIVRHVRPDLRPVLAYVAHGLRDDATDEREAARVAAIADRLALPHVVLPVTVERSGDGLEADARHARHRALEIEADRRGARWVLHGHHAEDQAETLLLRLVRGTGVDGLAGMGVAAGRRLRPLLDVRRADAHRAAEAVAPGLLEGAAHDPMNDDDALARVRLRRDVLPGLSGIAPDAVGALGRLAALARAESEVLDATVAELRTTLPVVTFGPATLVPSAALRALPLALGRRVVRAMLPEGDARSAADVERVLGAPDGSRATLPGPLDVSVDRGWHVVLPVAASAPVTTVPLAEGSEVLHPPSGMILAMVSAEGPGATLTARPQGGLPPGLDAARLMVQLRATSDLHVRCRRDGDRVRTPGGTRALGDVLAEAGVPLALRDLLPVVVDADRVAWLPGVVVDASLHDRSRGAGE